MAAVAVLLAALLDDRIAAVNAAGGLYAFQSALESPFCHLPADVIVPGLLTTADVADMVMALAPTPVRLERLVDGENRAAAGSDIEEALAAARDTYRAAGGALVIGDDESSGQGGAEWVVSQLKNRK
jgi:hypothetical protein